MNSLKYLLAVLTALCIHLHCSAQSFSNDQILHNLEALDKNHDLPNGEKLRLLYGWKKRSEELGLRQDSVYARLLHKIGALEFQINRHYDIAIHFTLKSLQINHAGKGWGSPSSAVKDYYNLAFFYDKMNLFKKALLYYDTAISITRQIPDIDHVTADSRMGKAYIYFRMGDYEKAYEESEIGATATLQARDSLSYLNCLIQRAQALFFQNKLPAAFEDVQTAIVLAKTLHRPFEMAGAWKTKGFIYAKQRAFHQAEVSFRTCIAIRVGTKQFWQVSSDYNDFGNFFSDSLKSYEQAADCFSKAIRYAALEGDSTRMARASINLGRSFFAQADLKRAMQSYVQAMLYLKISKGSDFLENPSTENIEPIGNKEMIQILFNSKTELLLSLYKERNDPKWLNACLRTALLNDSLVLEIRHELLGEQSKIYWREMTRGFYTNALEASFLAGDHQLAFFFMERSRSVLLQDKLHELGASAFLPPEETALQENGQIRIIELQQQLIGLSDTSSTYKNIRIQLLQAKEDLEQNIKTLERKFPSYFQYKYADHVRTLSDLQNYLSARRQRFLEYYIQDTASYILCIEPARSRLVKIAPKMGNIENLLNRFIHFCSDESDLNKNFPQFLSCSDTLYHLLFSPFQLTPGRVIVCQDNVLVPFEAFTRSPEKSDFLVQDYAFSYVYSAQFLMNPHEHQAARGDFLGVAPIHYGQFGGLPDLEKSGDALKICAAPYPRAKLLLDHQASRSNFLKQVSFYNTATVLTHASADNKDSEPLLYMSDSVIHLSELQILKRPSTKLIVLSACQTNAGRNLTGEGIYSLARGFSSAGIPSVAATQWVADDQSIYTISGKFNEYLAEGLNKDEALQKAKLFFIHTGNKANLLPFYWADLILIGNSDPVEITKGLIGNWWEPLLILASILLLLFIKRLGKS